MMCALVRWSSRLLVLICCSLTALNGCDATRHEPAGSASWPMYQLSAGHNAVVERSGFSKHWHYDANGRINGGYAVSDKALYLDTLEGDVLALRLDDGALIWKAHVDNMAMSTPIVIDGLVIVGTGKNAKSSGMSFAYATRPSEALPMWGRDEGDHIVAFDAATGERRWSYRTAGEDMPSPAVVGHQLVFANGDFHAYALDADTGNATWRVSLGGVSTMASATAIAPDAVLVSVCKDFDKRAATIAIDGDGHVRWRTPYGNCDASPTYGSSRIFLSGVEGSRERFGFGGRSVVSAVDASDGKLLWSYRDPAFGPYTEVGSSERAITGTFANDTYFQALATTDRVVAFSPGGRILWSVKTTAPVKMSPVVYDGRVFFGDSSGLLYVVDAKNGHLVSVKLFDEPFSTAPPIVVGQTIVIANGSSLYAMPIAGLHA